MSSPNGDLSNGWLGATSSHWKQQVGSVAKKSVLTYLRACEGDPSGTVWPSEARIALATECSISTVKRALKGLSKDGFVEIRPVPKPRGGFRNEYRVTGSQCTGATCTSPGCSNHGGMVTKPRGHGDPRSKEVEVKKVKEEGGIGSRRGGVRLTDEEFMVMLRASPAYPGIDIDVELAKLDAWLLANPRRRKTRRFIVAWLNRIDVGMPIAKKDITKGGQPTGFFKSGAPAVSQAEQRSRIESYQRQIKSRGAA